LTKHTLDVVEIVIAENGGADNYSPGTILKDALQDVPDGILGAAGPDRLYGLQDPLYVSGEYRLLNINSPRLMEIFWHSTAHLLAQAVLRLYPDTKLGIGPAIKDGFYYDFLFSETISADDLHKIEEEMKALAALNQTIDRSPISVDNAKDLFHRSGQPFKLELIEGFDEEISTYTQTNFTDICRGPHLPSTGLIRHLKLTALTGAYWRGDERNPMLQRIYGTAYPTAKLLRTHLQRIEEAKKRDHRLLGRKLGLFSFHPEAPGAPFWSDKGTILFNTIKQYVSRLLRKRGYSEVMTPLIMTRNLWERSGHWDHYKNNMYHISLDERDFAVKPMNCPGAVLMYKERQWSYKDLPLRWAEFGIVHRYEKSGTMHGLFRVRHITQDDAHIFCTPEQLVDVVVAMIDLVTEIFDHFGMSDMTIELSLRPKDRIGSEDMWDKAEDALTLALNEKGVDYEVTKGEGAFYGPKIDFHVIDSLGRSWQCSTIQLDFNFPERFDLEYIGADNQAHRPVMLHRAILGSMERFIGILIEHYAGDFPLWLSPEQAVLLPISVDQNEFADSVKGKLISAGIRCMVDDRNEKIGRKIRDAEQMKIPYMLVIGAREVESGEVSVRRRLKGDQEVLSVENLVTKLVTEAASVDK